MNRPATDWAGNILALAIVIIVNGMANAVPLGGQTTGEISDKYPSLFTPAGYVFSIWGLIYLGLIAFVIWQALPQQRTSQRLATIRLPFVLSCVCNAAWIFAWHYDRLWLSLALMLGLLLSLVTIYRALNDALSDLSRQETWLVKLPFSVYTGWITVAFIANFSAIQLVQGWDDLVFSAASWTVLKIAVAGSIAIWVLFRQHNLAFVLVIIWASIGIAFKHQAVPLVAGAAAVIACLVSLLILSESISRLQTFQGRDGRIQ